MAQQRQIKKLDELMDGALTERFNYEMDRVLQNVFDLNADPKKKRQIQIVIEITPNERRDAAEFKVDVKSKLAQPMPVAQTVMLILRFNENANAALFEGDGGAWKLRAVQNIRNWLVESLAGCNVEIIA